MAYTGVHLTRASKIAPREERDERKVKYSAATFGQIFTVMKISGTIVKRTNNSGRGFIFLKYLYCLLVSSIYLADAMRYTTACISKEVDELSNRAAGVLAMGVYLWVMPALSFGNVYLLSKHMPKITCALESYEEIYKLEMDAGYLHRRRINFFFNIVFSILFSPILLGLLFTYLSEESILMTLLVGFHYTNFTEKLLPIILVCLKMTWFSMSTLSSGLFMHEMCKFFKSEYSKITKILNDSLQETSAQAIEDKLTFCRKQHEALTSLVFASNPIMEFDLLIAYSSGIPMVCLLLYGLLTGNLILEDMILLLNYFVGVVFGMIHHTLHGTIVNSRAHEVKEVLFQFDLNSLSEKANRQINVFLARVNGPPIGINVYGLFFVDASCLLMLFGTVLTYSIVVFQTTGSPNCNCSTQAIGTLLLSHNVTTQ